LYFLIEYNKFIQKPVGVLRRIILASSNSGETVMDFFAGSGTVGAVCLELEREFILVDNNPQAIDVMKQRFAGMENIEWL
jgi:site-specific DNA-methyltransferase (adenine-specific)